MVVLETFPLLYLREWVFDPEVLKALTLFLVSVLCPHMMKFFITAISVQQVLMTLFIISYVKFFNCHQRSPNFDFLSLHLSPNGKK